MIRYALCCDEGHRFESWFHDSAAFDEQASRGLVSCPACDSHHVVKAIMAPALVAGRGARSRLAADTLGGETTDGAAPSAEDSATASVASPDTLPVALADADHRQRLRAIRDRVLAETRDVGRAFASEARRIHDADVAAPERIRGQATLREARDLIEDGILVLPLPPCPDDLN